MREHIEFILDYYGQEFKTGGLTCWINVEKNRLECAAEIKQPAPIRDAEFYIPIEFFGALKKEPEEHLT